MLNETTDTAEIHVVISSGIHAVVKRDITHRLWQSLLENLFDTHALTVVPRLPATAPLVYLRNSNC